MHDPAPTLRRITKRARHPAKVTSWQHPDGHGRVWWVDGVAYTDDPQVIAACARKGCIVEDAPGGVPAEYRARVKDAERRRAERDAKPGRGPRPRRTDTP